MANYNGTDQSLLRSANRCEDMTEGADIDGESEDEFYFYDEEDMDSMDDKSIRAKQTSSGDRLELSSSQQASKRSCTYEVIDFTQTKVKYISKLVMIKNKFSYLNLSDSFFRDTLHRHRYRVDKASQYITDNISSILDTAIDTSRSSNCGRRSVDRSIDHTCMISWQSIRGDSVYHLDCGHVIDRSCMAAYIVDHVGRHLQSSIACPIDDCGHSVSHVDVDRLCDMSTSDIYYRRLMASFVDASDDIIRCCCHDCDLMFDVYRSYDDCRPPMAVCAMCKCGWLTCLECGKRGHEPMDCRRYGEWMTKADAIKDDLNSNWVKQNTKKCPQCKTDIQKNEGCMHMTCKMCKNQFCWLCLGSWTEHNENTGGFFKCNRFTVDESKDAEDIDMERFQFYMDRYIEHDKSYHLSQRSLQYWSDELSSGSAVGKFNIETGGSLNYYIECLRSSIAARNFITYTYALGYNISNRHQSDLFAINQYMLEQALEKLDRHLNDSKPSDTISMVDSSSIDAIRSSSLSLSSSLSTMFNNAKIEFESYRFAMIIDNKTMSTDDDSAIDRKTASIDDQTIDKHADGVSMYKLLAADKTKVIDSKKKPQSWSCTHCTYYNENNTNKICRLCDRMGRPK